MTPERIAFLRDIVAERAATHGKGWTGPHGESLLQAADAIRELCAHLDTLTTERDAYKRDSITPSDAAELLDALANDLSGERSRPAVPAGAEIVTIVSGLEFLRDLPAIGTLHAIAMRAADAAVPTTTAPEVPRGD